MSYYRRKKMASTSAIDNLINLAPMVDLLFTLLIVFMLPTQVLFGNIKVEIPKGQADVIPVKVAPVAVYITSNGSIFIEDNEVRLSNLADEMINYTMKNYNHKIFILGDKHNSYGRVISVLDVLNSAGFKDVILITDINKSLKKEIR